MLACNLPGIAAQPTSLPVFSDTPPPPPTLKAPPAPQTIDTDTPEAPSETPEPTEVIHQDVPAAASGKPTTIADQSSRESAPLERAYGGDEYYNGRLERPFDAQMMRYLPWLDIARTHLVGTDALFYYFSLELEESPNNAEGDAPVYGFEIDSDLDGRGDLLLAASAPFLTEWGQEGVRIWQDSDNSVGGVTPIRSDPPPGGGDGYDRLVFETGLGDNPDLLWARLDPMNARRVEMALLKSFLQDVRGFTWGAYADGFERSPAGFDFNDRWTLAEAGSAMKGDHYPLKAFYAFDNTCRTGSGSVPPGVPGLCPVYIPPTGTAEVVDIPVQPTVCVILSDRIICR
jgi:hypothetical protein